MKQKRSFWDAAILHPFLFAYYPLLALWETNIAQIPPFAIVRAVFILTILLALSLAASLLLFRNRVKAAMSTSLLMLLSLTYGHFFGLIDQTPILGFDFGRHRFVLPVWGGLAVVGLVLLWRTKKPLVRLNYVLNLVSIFLVVLALAGIGAYEARYGFTRFQANASPAEKQSARRAVSPPADGPDVYYLLIDGFARADALKAMGGPDVSGFLNEISKMGFFIATCSQDNYDHTRPAMASTLNMDYLEALNLPLNLNRDSIPAYTEVIQHNRARKAFEAMGYKFITFKPVYTFLNIPDSDYYYDAEQVAPFYNRLEVVNFQYLFLSTTILRPLMEAQDSKPHIFEKLPIPVVELLYPKASVYATREYKQYQQNLYSLQKLSEVTSLPGKKFVYAHLFITHQPYVFNADGSFRWPPKDDDQAYFAQIEYLRKRLPEVIQKILRDSKTPPVIILQSDHGYVNTVERVKIINAYYLPGGGEKDVYPSITPVNSFRVVLNRYFNGKHPLLKDRTFHIVDDTHMAPVSNPCIVPTP